MSCPTCGDDLYWVAVEEHPAGGWWQCDQQHRWRRLFGGFAPLELER